MLLVKKTCFDPITFLAFISSLAFEKDKTVNAQDMSGLFSHIHTFWSRPFLYSPINQGHEPKKWPFLLAFIWTKAMEFLIILDNRSNYGLFRR